MFAMVSASAGVGRARVKEGEGRAMMIVVVVLVLIRMFWVLVGSGGLCKQWARKGGHGAGYACLTEHGEN